MMYPRLQQQRRRRQQRQRQHCRWFHQRFQLFINTILFLTIINTTTTIVHPVQAQSSAIREGGGSGGGVVSTDKTCYVSNEDIIISFLSEQPGDDDWIGIYPSAMISGTEEPLMWVWTCGTQDCWGRINRGSITFGATGVTVDYIDEWPLNVGDFRAVLGRDSEGDEDSYEIYAASSIFKVVPTGDLCSYDDYTTPSKAPAVPTPLPTQHSPTTTQPTQHSPTTTQPSHSPTPRPSHSPTPRPSYSPTPPQLTTPPPIKNDSPPVSSNNKNVNMLAVIAAAKQDIAYLILKSPYLSARFLQLVFYDCVGGCDGCINMSNPSSNNAKLDETINILAPIVEKYKSQGLSRPDTWVLASYVGVEMAMLDTEDFVAIPLTTIGRQSQSCSSDDTTQGPNPDMCSSNNVGTDDILNFFRAHFHFTPQETAAIMGSHTIGVMKRENRGFDGPYGRTLNNKSFNNDYYKELVGDGTTVDDQVERAPNWKQVFVNNSDLGNVPNVFQWEGWPNFNQKIVMANSDIALVRQLHAGNMASDGAVACKFVPRGNSNKPTCPMARSDLFSHMITFRNDNQAFLEKFRDALFKLTQTGYAVSNCDNDGICNLIKL